MKWGETVQGFLAVAVDVDVGMAQEESVDETRDRRKGREGFDEGTL